MMIFLLLMAMTFMGASASIFFKRASGGSGIFEIIKNWNLYAGGGLYAAAAVINIIVLRYMDYSVVLPLTSITYIWTMILSASVLKEKITGRKIAGVICIIIGAACVAA